jgi:multidrug resistance efflux pump
MEKQEPSIDKAAEAVVEAPVAPEAIEPQEPARKSKPKRDLGRVVAMVLFGLATALFIYHLFADRMTPFSSAGYLRTYLVAIIPEVTGTVMEVNVDDNSRVEEGQILFQLDTADYEIAVATAEAQLAQAGQSMGANTAGVSAAQASVSEARANYINAQEDAGRILELVIDGVYAQARGDEAQGNLDAAAARLQQAQAALVQAQEALGPTGTDNPLLQAAIADLDKAQLNLLRTSILAPSDGAVTGLQLSPGVQANAGQPVMTFIDLRDIWIVAYLTENNLGNVQSGDSVEIAFDVFPGKVFHGTVQSIGFGVEVEDTSVAGTLPSGLPGASVTSGDLRFPMRITIDGNKYPKGLRFGARTSVVVYTDASNGIMDLLGRLRVRLASYWNYVD